MSKSKKKYFNHIIDSTLTGIGALIALSVIGLVAEEVGYMMIIAPFGATAVLLFSVPDSRFSKPINVFAGYFIATFVGFIVLHYSSGNWLSVGVGLGATIMFMHLFNVIHPPAGANYFIVIQGQFTMYSVEPIFIGLVTLVTIGIVVEKIRKSLADKCNYCP
ncbi:HPP family protein [Sulfurovum sp.]|uniref:HPP family protein n=1 Tax=Sulfurovum sp. TaxID=1969726 RepID=UPI0035693F70